MGRCEVVAEMNILSLTVGLLSGIIGGMGLGGGAVLLMYLRLFTDISTETAQGINLLFFIPIALASVIIYCIKKQIEFSVILPMAAGGVMGSVGGFFLSKLSGADITGKIFAVFLIVMGIKEIFSLIALIKRKKCGIVKKE